MLAYKLIVMFTPSFGCAEGEVQRERKGFLRLWRWTVVLIAMQDFCLLPRPRSSIMMRETYADRHHHPPLLESAEILVAAVLMLVVLVCLVRRDENGTS